MTRRRLFVYLFLNAIVTVLVAWAVFYFHDRLTPQQDCTSVQNLSTLPAAAIKVDITSVTGAGALASETVTIQNYDDTAFTLTGWTLKDNQGTSYTFPQVTLFPGASLQVHTGPGTDSAGDLYWQMTSPVWKSGQLVALYDPQNIARAFYRIP